MGKFWGTAGKFGEIFGFGCWRGEGEERSGEGAGEGGEKEEGTREGGKRSRRGHYYLPQLSDLMLGNFFIMKIKRGTCLSIVSRNLRSLATPRSKTMGKCLNYKRQIMGGRERFACGGGILQDKK